MSNIQTTLPFCVKKKAQSEFYSKSLNDKNDECNQEKQIIRKPTALPVKKIVELDSDDENIDLSSFRRCKKNLKRKYVRSTASPACESTDDSDCSPTKLSRTIKNKLRSNKAKNVQVSNIGENDSEDVNNCNLRMSINKGSHNNLPGRKYELEYLCNFLNDHLKNAKSGSMYISGPPGTGKTACLTNILQRQEFQKKFKEVYINCTVIKSPTNIYVRICQELNIKVCGSTEKKYLKSIEKYLNTKHDMILLVLDEIDQLCNKNQAVLYTLFEWPSQPRSNLVLIGIANALDLTDRILPRLNLNIELKPCLMHFAPYSKEQIIEIFTDRLKENMNTDLFSPAAIQMLAAKVAAVSGDIRRALDIGRRVIELASPRTSYTEKTNQVTKTNPVELKQVMSVLDNVYGISQRLETDIDDSFPLQQKILICSILLILKNSKNKDITVGKLHDIYKRICTKRNIAAIDSAEFFGMCTLVETRGIIKLSGRKEPRFQRINLQWDEIEINSALKDKQLISDILSDTTCLS